MITKAYIIRHGLTINAEEKRYQGRLDVPLAREGEAQMQRLSHHLVCETTETGPAAGTDHFLDAVYCSDLQRARKSAEIIGRPFGLKPIIISDFRERSFGHWEGLTFYEIMQTYPQEIGAWTNDPLKFFPAGGESTLEVRNRVMPAFNEILSEKRGGKFAVIAHGGVNRIILCEVLGIALQNLFRIEQDFSALNVINFYKEAPVLIRMNYVVTAGRI